ncbi:peptidase M48, Ste24p [Streptomyces lincolnensis]|uniref:Peptidase M48, Ste24p n=1 Tax=Streptomyces lincolnensis TaxID=1915 RepID=A0A1B1MFQ3_STRLN|nr:M48 family metalloprotease [Streptomyces lincolnensis]ANS67460.1 peptidase M48, Ste24p [Streptomyces lincolnensis]AXG54775.1 peptidase [Streptomyces lincolnensis]QMV09127.1 M48 family metalloprotease [Streptomyces lincolnensis]
MRAVGEETLQPCPQCGTEIRTDARFTRWCAACDWNVDPERAESDEKRSRLESLRHELAQRYGEQLLAELSAEGEQRRGGRDTAGILAYAIALAVHGVTATLVASGLWILIAGSGAVAKGLGILLLALAWPLRPRLNRLPKDARVLTRTEAPELYGLVDEIARTLGTKGVDTIVVDTEVNASVTHYGLGRRLLTLGIPLWEVLTPQQRIALLGHELGHFTNGDTRHGLVVGTAYRSLSLWHYFLAPTPNPTLLEMFVNLVYLVPRSLIQGVLMLLDLLTARASQRSEYLADAVAARAGSTEAAVGLMDRLLVTDSVVTTLHRETNSRRTRRPGQSSTDDSEGLWEALTAHMTSIPPSEYDRQRRAAALRGHSVDSTHPPTHLRRRLLLTGPPAPATVTADAGRADLIATELTGARKALAREVVRDGYRGV